MGDQRGKVVMMRRCALMARDAASTDQCLRLTGGAKNHTGRIIAGVKEGIDQMESEIGNHQCNYNGSQYSTESWPSAASLNEELHHLRVFNGFADENLSRGVRIPIPIGCCD